MQAEAAERTMPTRSAKQKNLVGVAAKSEVADLCGHFATEETSLHQLPVEFSALVKVHPRSDGYVV
jgi:hypothetical protein